MHCIKMIILATYKILLLYGADRLGIFLYNVPRKIDTVRIVAEEENNSLEW